MWYPRHGSGNKHLERISFPNSPREISLDIERVDSRNKFADFLLFIFVCYAKFSWPIFETVLVYNCVEIWAKKYLNFEITSLPKMSARGNTGPSPPPPPKFFSAKHAYKIKFIISINSLTFVSPEHHVNQKSHVLINKRDN